ncbi:hypothetical protein [Pedobacter sp. L105]|uniref:hypothetical protein n=1 Tax=Pedobacter sp. L105 TaxID=1641871 RepID=UPI00131D7966|nr:hypothetical protein [Pedobacter sp. L105]
MGKYRYLLALILLFASCTKDSDFDPVKASEGTVKDAGLIAFKMIPLSANQVNVAFANTNPDQPLAKVILREDSTVLATTIVDTSPGMFTATFTYAFQAGKKYNFLVQSAASSKTIKQYRIPEYIHQYVSEYAYQKILPLTQGLGINSFDLSPSRNYLFITDYINNISQIKRVNLQTLAAENVSNSLSGLLIRAVSDDDILVYGDKTTQNLPATPDPGDDAEILARYSMLNQRSVFVDYVSSGYGRTSRIVDNHVLVTNPIYTRKTASLINLIDLSKVEYPLSNFDFRFISFYSFNDILYDNMIVNPANGQFSTPVTLDDNSGLVNIDHSTGYIFTATTVENAAHDFLNGYSVYKGNTLVYRSDTVALRSIDFPIIYNIKNDVVTFHQGFGYDTKVNIDGYYILDLKTKELKLVQADSSPYVIEDYQMKDGSVISIRADGVYKLTLK